MTLRALSKSQNLGAPSRHSPSTYTSHDASASVTGRMATTTFLYHYFFFIRTLLVPLGASICINKYNIIAGAWKYIHIILYIKGTVQPELRWVKIGINRTAMKICIAGKCRLSCPKGHHHERSINILSGCSTF